MTQILKRLSCWLFGHDLVEVEILSEMVRRVRCDKCGGQWAVHEQFGWFRWDADFERHYDRTWRIPV